MSHGDAAIGKTHLVTRSIADAIAVRFACKCISLQALITRGSQRFIKPRIG